MPLHDWEPIPTGLYHDFHQTWSIYIKVALNGGLLPAGLSALVEQRTGPPEGDVLAVERRPRQTGVDPGGLLTAERPSTSLQYKSATGVYADRANRIVVRHHLGRTVAVIEIVSPGNKDSRRAIRDFVEKTIDYLRAGVHVLVIDPFPPGPRDPLGLHKLLWDEISDQPFAFPPGKDRILAAYEAGGAPVAYVEPTAVGDTLASMPLFVADGLHVKVPLESSYMAAWASCPADMRTAVETGVLPDPDADD